MDDDILEPIESYNKKYKELHLENTIKYFDELTSKSGIDVEENRKTVKEYKNIENENNILKGKRNKFSTIKVILTVLAIILLASSIFTILLMISQSVDIVGGIIVCCCCALLGVGSLLYIFKKLNKQIKLLDEQIAKLESKMKDLYNLAWRQMMPLNSLYDWGIPGKIITNTIPLIQMDKNFDVKKYRYLQEKYGFELNKDSNVSTYFCQSGSILGNPFLLCKDYIQTMYNKVYTGSITIHWTTRVSTKNGTRTVHHSQTLTASLSKPAPKYQYDTYLIYGNDAAPDLSFSRSPSGIKTSDDEKDIKKFVKKQNKKLDDLQEKSISNGKNFTRLANEEFEALFNAINRDHEVQYRLLFTPLAQNNMLDLLKSKEPFGDDFYFKKHKQLNFISSKHSQSADYYANPLKFISFDYDDAKEDFIKYNQEYFKNFFFDLAPLISIPLYQQHKTIEYLYNEEFEYNVSPSEHEVMANSFDVNLLKDKSFATPSILKTKLNKKVGLLDEVTITANAFEAYKRVTYINKMGADGRMHTIPVYWIEYIPISKDTVVTVANLDTERSKYNSLKNNQAFNNLLNRLNAKSPIYERGLFACILGRGLSIDDSKAFSDVVGINNTYEGKMEDILKNLDNEIKTTMHMLNSNLADDKFSNSILDDEKYEYEEVKPTDEDLAFDKVKDLENDSSNIDTE